MRTRTTPPFYARVMHAHVMASFSVAVGACWAHNLLAELDAQLAMRKIAGSNYIIRVSISE